MKNILIVKKVLPYPMSHGGHLRVVNLVRALGTQFRCYLAAFDDNPEALQAVQQSGIFEQLLVLPGPQGKASSNRLFRSSNASFFRLSHPQHFRDTTRRLKQLIDEYRIDIVIASNLNVAEYVAPLSGVTKVVDDFDCQTLTLEREYQVKRDQTGWMNRLLSKLEIYRVSNQESRLGSEFDLVTTIARPDQERLQQISRRHGDIVHVVPNGVAPELLEERYPSDEIPAAVVFWGNLNFPPNHSAVEYFYRDIYVPFLQARGIKWYIVGPEADDWIKSLDSRHEGIEVTGFIEDLYSFVMRVPVVVNPMIMGSGLKNKVLEAFALNRAVVSTPMGVEAIEGCGDQHCVQRDDPEAFAHAVLNLLDSPSDRSMLGANARRLVVERYTWESIGKHWNALISAAATPGP